MHNQIYPTCRGEATIYPNLQTVAQKRHCHSGEQVLDDTMRPYIVRRDLSIFQKSIWFFENRTI